jgi:hypothetical protein
LTLNRPSRSADNIFIMVPVLDELPPALKSRADETTEIPLRDVLMDVRVEDDGRRTIVLTFVLADPPEGMETWPVDELWALRRVAREVVPEALAKVLEKAAKDHGVEPDELPSYSWTVEFRPEQMPPIAPDDVPLTFED